MESVKFSIKANVFRGASLFVEKKGFRDYLKYIFIGKGGKVLSSNGHVGFISSHDADIEKDYLIKLDQKIPPTASVVHFKIVDNDVIATFEVGLGRVLNKRILGSLFVSEEDPLLSFPVDTLIGLVPKESDKEATTRFYANAHYLSLAGLAFGKKEHAPILVNNYKQGLVVITTSMNYNHMPEDTKILLMKVRE